MRKIAILSYYSGVVERGVETFAIEIAKRLSQRYEVTIFQSGNINWIKKNSKSQKIQIIQVKPFAKNPSHTRSKFSKLYLDFQSLKILIFSMLVSIKLFKHRPRAIIALNGGWQTVLLRLVSKIIKAKLIICGQAGIGSDDAWNLLFRPDVFIALTKSQYDWAKRISPETQIVNIPNGVDLSQFNPKVIPKDIKLEPPIVICTAALDPYKRVEQTIRAVAKTNQASLLILGDGKLKGSIDALGKRLLGKRYLRLVVPHNQIASYYKAGKIFTLVSKTEAFGTSYIEAMACNLPVVATCDESRAQIIGRAGILTKPEEMNVYARDLSIALKTNYRNIPYSQALQFSWNKVVQQYMQLIKKLI